MRIAVLWLQSSGLLCSGLKRPLSTHLSRTVTSDSPHTQSHLDLGKMDIPQTEAIRTQKYSKWY